MGGLASGRRAARNLPAHAPLGASQRGRQSQPPARRPEAARPAPIPAWRLLSHAPGKRGRCPPSPHRAPGPRGAGEGRVSRVRCSPPPTPAALPPSLASRPPTSSGSIPAARLPGEELPGCDPAPDPKGRAAARGCGRCGRDVSCCPGLRGPLPGLGGGPSPSWGKPRGRLRGSGSGWCQGGPVLPSIHLPSLPCTRITLARESQLRLSLPCLYLYFVQIQVFEFWPSL